MMKRWRFVVVLLALIWITGVGLQYWVGLGTVSNELLSEPISTVQGTSQETSTSGRLLMIDQSIYPNHKIVSFDLDSTWVTTIFTAPQHSWLYQLDVSTDGRQVALAYSAPPVNDQSSNDQSSNDQSSNDQSSVDARQPYDRSGIYLLALDDPAATPVVLLGDDEAGAYAFNPIWSADNNSIYYVSYRRILAVDGEAQSQSQQTQQSATLDVALYRYDIPSGEKTLIAQDGVWPRLSSDGEKLVYIQVDPISSVRSIRVTDRDGKNALAVVAANDFFDIDTPLFSPDDQWIYFSAVPHSTKVSSNGVSNPEGLSWWETLLGVKVAYAHTDHNVPSDWWRVAITGGKPEQLTTVRSIISFGDFNNPGKANEGDQQLFYTSNTGVYSMDAKGEGLERLPLPMVYQMIAWTR